MYLLHGKQMISVHILFVVAKDSTQNIGRDIPRIDFNRNRQKQQDTQNERNAFDKKTKQLPYTSTRHILNKKTLQE